MSDNQNNQKTVPLECPSNQQATKIDSIVDVVENELFPPANKDVQAIISKTQQG